MNILVTGANGQLGNEMRIVSRGSADNYLFTDVAGDAVYLDITDPSAVRAMVAENDIDVIVNCAAYTNVEAAETNMELAERLNAGAPAILAAAMKERGGLLVHISTDYVFGKEPYNKPCREDQQGTPTGVYGLTKLHGEQRIMESGCDYVIIRTAWLYSEFGKNFLKTMLALTSSKPSISVVFDQAGTPTYALDLAKAIAVILADYSDWASLPHVSGIEPTASKEHYRHTGIYHYSNEGVCSWYDFARAIAVKSGNGSCEVRPCHSDEFPSAVVRPAYSVLDKTLAKKTFGISIPYWTDSLDICIKNLKERGI